MRGAPPDLRPLPRGALERFPPERPTAALEAEVRGALGGSESRVVVLDDDPTGVQGLHDVDVLTRWTERDLMEAVQRPEPLFFVLTNSRALPADEASRLAAELARTLSAVQRATGVPLEVISRSDSTLRGHYPGELEPLSAVYGGHVDGHLLVPAYIGGGRITVHGVHYVYHEATDNYLPVTQTEFAHDPTFAYTHAYLPAWVEEKTHGRWRADQTLLIGIETLREEGPKGVARILLTASRNQPIVCDAVSDADLLVLVAGLVHAEACGKRFLCRTAASFVRARIAQAPRALLSQRELVSDAQRGGLVLVGSFVKRTANQLRRALELPDVVAREAQVETLLQPALAKRHIKELAAWADATMETGKSALVYTTRRLLGTYQGLSHLQIGRSVSHVLAQLPKHLTRAPAWIVAKGGITSHDVAVYGLGVRRARVLGEAVGGCPAWRLGEEARFPGLTYVVFPGNVGTDHGLAELIQKLSS
jgi:uncharacterized protein YgbK (DUF1537 family)